MQVNAFCFLKTVAKLPMIVLTHLIVLIEAQVRHKGCAEKGGNLSVFLPIHGEILLLMITLRGLLQINTLKFSLINIFKIESNFQAQTI